MEAKRAWGLAQGRWQSQDPDLGFQTPQSKLFQGPRAPLPVVTCGDLRMPQGLEWEGGGGLLVFLVFPLWP